MIIDSGLVTGSLEVVGNTAMTGSLSVTGDINGSLKGNADSATTASYAVTASYLEGYISPFPFTGSAQITGSLQVTGSITATSFVKEGGTSSEYLMADGSTSEGGTGGGEPSARVEENFIATAGQTVFPITYEIGQIDVYFNGLKLYPDEYTANNGTSVVLAEAATLGSQVSIVKYVSATTSTAVRNEVVFEATADQNTFLVDYTVGQVDVFHNGAKLNPEEFTATNGTSVVLGFDCLEGASVTMLVYLSAVSGASGTANYVTKFTGAATMEDSQIYDDGTDIGIGKDSPNAKLDINGNTIVTGSLNVTQGITGSLFGTSSNAVSASFATNATSSSYALSASYSSNVSGTVNYIPRFTGTSTIGDSVIFQSGSNIGIGTTNASVKTTVRASDAPTLPTLGTASGHFLIGNGATNVDYGLMFGVNGDGNTWIQSQRVDGTATAYNTILQPKGGNVGVGTDPDTLLHVYGTAGWIKAETNSNNSARFQAKNSSQITDFGTDSNGGFIQTQGAYPLLVYTNQTERMRITSGGNVGIGNPPTITYRLQVKGNGFAVQGDTLNQGNSIRFLRESGAEMAYIGWSNEATNNSTWLFKSSNGNPIGFSADGTNQNMVINTSGNVGIGLTTPLNGGGNGRWLTLEGTSYSGGLICSINGASTGAVYTESGYFNMQANSGYGIKLFSNGGEALKIDTSGRVTTPQQPAFRAWYSINATWTLANGATFNFNVTEYNIGSCYNTSNGVFTAPVAGVYQFNFYTIVLGNYANASIQFRKNGGVATSGYNVHFSPSSADVWSNVVYTTSMYLNQGDYVNMINSSGFSVNFHGKDWSSFSGYLVG
jgi:hypothetical protein